MSVDSNWTVPADWTEGRHVHVGAESGAPSATELFYQADERRRTSGEMDFGAYWWDGQQGHSGQWRVSCVRDTGEVYGLEYRGVPDRLVVLGVVEGDDVYAAAEELLAGWPDVCGLGGSLGWVLARFASGPDPG